MWCFQFVWGLITNLSVRKVPLNSYSVSFRSWFELFDEKYKELKQSGQIKPVCKIHETIKNHYNDFVTKYNNQISIKEFSEIMNEYGQNWFDISEYGGDADETINFLANLFQISITDIMTTKMFNRFASCDPNLYKPCVLVNIDDWLKAIIKEFEDLCKTRFDDNSNVKFNMYPLVKEIVQLLERLSYDIQKHGYMINIETFIKEALQSRHNFSLFYEEHWESAMTLVIQAFEKAERCVGWIDILIKKEMDRSSGNIFCDVDLETWTRTHWGNILSESEIQKEIEEEKTRYKHKRLMKHSNGNYVVTTEEMGDKMERDGIAERTETVNLL